MLYINYVCKPIFKPTKIKSFISSFLFLSFIFLFPSPHVIAQSKDSLVIIAKEKAKSVFRGVIAENSNIYIGKEDTEIESKSKGHPYFEKQGWLIGSVVYNENLYENVFLKYNIVSQQLILQHWGGYLKIELVKSKIKSFTVLGQSFIHIQPDSSSKSELKSGFYKLLDNKNIVLICKYYKTKSENINGGEIITEYKENKDYFLIKDNITTKIKSLNTFETVFPDKNIKKITHDLNLDGKKDIENTYIQLLKNCTFEK